MKTIGMIGGTSWVSTLAYYKIINELTNERLGKLHSAKIFLYSIDFDEFKTLADQNAWPEIAKMFINGAQRLEKAGSDCIVLCSNTTHIIADDVQQSIAIPLIHIVDATATAIGEKQINTVGLLGTKFTMEHSFFAERLKSLDIEPIIPNASERKFIHESIFSELTKNIFKPETKKFYLTIIQRLINEGAQGIIFGCTEIPLLIKPEECSVPIFDTTIIHARSAVNFALAEI
ncbi:aspartate/glutamate racemase family protein [bacterium]|nr:aspartate/glutamate racemase family protein [bacterium]